MANVAVISGGRTGIGRAAATLFGRSGYQVIVLSRQAFEFEEGSTLTLDLGSPDHRSAQLPKLRAMVAGADKLVLIHNAAAHHKGGTAQLQVSDLRASLEVNVLAAAELNTLLIPHMKPGSAILYLGSTLSEKAVACCAAYVIAKHAVVGMMRATCQDLAGTGIHTLCLCPGFTDTEMLRMHVGDDPAALAKVAAISTQNRLISPEEIAQTLLFCASHPVVNGAVLHANLGQVER